MTPKEYLSQVERLNTQIQQRIQERDDIRRRLGLGGVDYSRPTVQSSPKPEASFTRAVERMAELEGQIDELVDRFVAERDTIIGQIQELDNALYVKVLYKRYVECKRLEVISVEMNYSYIYVRETHGRALVAFGKKFLAE